MLFSFPAYIILNSNILTPHAICSHSQHRTLSFKHKPTGKVTFPYTLSHAFEVTTDSEPISCKNSPNLTHYEHLNFTT